MQKKHFQSSNINKVIKAVLNFLFFYFFHDKISQVQKARNVIMTIQFFNRTH